MDAGQMIMIGLALLGVGVVWMGLFLASLWASEKIMELYNEVRASMGCEPDEHAADYERKAG